MVSWLPSVTLVGAAFLFLVVPVFAFAAVALAVLLLLVALVAIAAAITTASTLVARAAWQHRPQLGGVGRVQRETAEARPQPSSLVHARPESAR